MRFLEFEGNRTKVRIPHTLTFKLPEPIPCSDFRPLFLIALILLSSLSPVFATAWEISSVDVTGKKFDFSTEVDDPSDVYFSNNGSLMYIIDYGQNDNRIFQYWLSTAWDVTSASVLSGNCDTTAQDDYMASVTLSEDGSKLYTVGWTGDKVYQYSLSTPFDISTCSYDSVSLSLWAGVNYANKAYFSENGTILIVSEDTTDKVGTYVLSSAWDLSTASDDGQWSFSEEVSLYGVLAEKVDGKYGYILGGTGDKVYQYTLSTGWDWNTATYNGEYYYYGGECSLGRGFDISRDGTRLYILCDDDNNIYEYHLNASEKYWYAINESSGTSITNYGEQSTVGTLTGSGAWTTGGPVWNDMYDFGASNDDMSIASFTPTSKMTVCMDIQPDDISALAWVWYTNDDDAGSEVIHMYVADGSPDTINCRVSNGATHRTATNEIKGDGSTWYQICCVYDDINNNIKGYINGTAFTTQVSGSAFTIGGEDSMIYADNDNGGGSDFEGVIANARVYTKELNSSQISWLYNSHSFRDCSLENYPNDCDAGSPPNPYGKYNSTLLLDNSSLHLFPFNTEQNFNVTAYNDTGDYLDSQMLNASSPDIPGYEGGVNVTAGTNLAITFNNSEEYQYVLRFEDFYNSSTYIEINIETHRINDLSINNNQTFFLPDDTCFLNTTGTYVNGSEIYYNEPINYSVGDIGYDNVLSTTNTLFPITLNNSEVWNYSSVANWTRYGLSVNSNPSYVFSSVYNISNVDFDTVVPSGSTQFINVSVGERFASTGQVNNVSIVWNGSTYYMTEWSSNEWSWSNSPSTSEPTETINFTIWLNTTFNSEMVSLTNESSQVISNIQLDDCSVYSNQILNLSLVDEVNVSAVTGDVDVYFNIRGVSPTVDYFFELRNDTTFQICINNTLNFVADVDFSFWSGDAFGASDKEKREYFLLNSDFNATSQDLFLYLLSRTYAEKIKFTILDLSEQPYVDHYVKIKRWVGTGYILVGMAKTDFDGEALSYLDYDDTYYRIEIVDPDGITLHNTSKNLFDTFENTIYVSEVGSVNYNEEYNHIHYSDPESGWDNSTEMFSVTVYDDRNEQFDLNLLVKDLNGAIICDRDYTSADVTAVCPIPNATATYLVTATAESNGLTIHLFTYEIDESFDDFDYEETGVFVTAMLLLGVAFTGLVVNPRIIPALAILAITAGFFMGLVPIEITIIGGLFFAAIIIMSVVKK